MKEFAGQTVPLIVKPLACLGRFESSNRWPLDPGAIQKCKLALLLRTRLELHKQFKVRPLVCFILFNSYNSNFLTLTILTLITSTLVTLTLVTLTLVTLILVTLTLVTLTLITLTLVTLTLVTLATLTLVIEFCLLFCFTSCQ